MTKRNPQLEFTFKNLERTIGNLPKFFIMLSKFTRNHFWKYIGNEDRVLFLTVAYIRSKYPNALFLHPMNEGKKSPYEQYLTLWNGMLKGAHDLLILDPILEGTVNPQDGKPVRKYNGLSIELKSGNGKLSPEQITFKQKATECGWLCVEVWTFEDAKSIIDQYMNMTAQKLKG